LNVKLKNIHFHRNTLLELYILKQTSMHNVWQQLNYLDIKAKLKFWVNY